MEKKTIRVEVPEKVIKATFYEKEIYVASDGDEFIRAIDCEYHEKVLGWRKTIEHIPYMDYTGYGLFEGEYYYLRSQDDFNALYTFIKHENYVDGSFYVPGWYRVEFENGVDSRDSYTLTSMAYISTDYDELNKQLANVLEK